MTIEQAVLVYAVLIFIFLVPLIWLFLKRRAEKKIGTVKTSENVEDVPAQPARKAIDWNAVRAFRPHALLTGDMWLKTFVAAFVALCVGVIIVVFVFPLGAGWAASAAFMAVVVIVALMFSLID
jgi:hypothetical protein